MTYSRSQGVIALPGESLLAQVQGMNRADAMQVLKTQLLLYKSMVTMSEEQPQRSWSDFVALYSKFNVLQPINKYGPYIRFECSCGHFKHHMHCKHSLGLRPVINAWDTSR